mgnify:FL=1
MKALFMTLLALTVGSAFAGEALFTPGTCTGSARTGRGPVKVKVTFSPDAITAVKIVRHSETPGIAAKALEKIPERILAAQTDKVDTVSGATLTSRAIRRAAAQCINQHRTK